VSIRLSLPTPSLTNDFAPSIIPASYAVPGTLTNNQSTATPANFQQMITVNSSTYQSYLDSNLDNVQWQNANGEVLNSWLESGNTNSSTSTVYWVNLGSLTIPANGTLMINYCIFPLKQSNFNATTTGLAPQLSTIYAQYDNAASIFSSYDNFSGTTLNTNTWTAPSTSYTVNNGLTIKNGGGELISIAKYSAPTPVFDMFGSFSGFNSNNQQVFGLIQSAQPYEYWINDGNGDTGAYYLANYSAGFAPRVALGFNTANVNLVLSNWVTSTKSGAMANYGTPATSSTNFTAPTAAVLDFGERAATTYTAFAQWIRSRVYPPNGVMPTATFGSIV